MLKKKKEYGGFNTFASNFNSSDNKFFNNNEYPLNLGRHALDILIKCRSISKILVPAYTCESIHKTLKNTDVEVNYYHIGEDFSPLLTDIDIKNSQALLINNYFGISGKIIEKLIQNYGSKIIVDNSQSYYSKHSMEIDHFKSPRKFFGTTDGGILITSHDIGGIYKKLKSDKSADRIFNLFASDETSKNENYKKYLNYRNDLQSLPAMKMSKSTEGILRLVDFNFCKQARLRNFEIFHKNLSSYNKLIFSKSNGDVPMFYPFLYPDSTLKKKLLQNNIYIGSFWPSSSYCNFSTETEDKLRTNLCCLPIDQTLNSRDIEFICRRIINLINR